MSGEISKEFTTSLRLKQYMDKTGMRQKDILEKCKPYCTKYNIDISKSLLSSYIAGRMEPGNKRLFILSKALKVSELWLLGFDVPMEPEAELQEDKNALKVILSSLNETGRDKLLEYARDLADNPKYTI